MNEVSLNNVFKDKLLEQSPLMVFGVMYRTQDLFVD